MASAVSSSSLVSALTAEQVDLRLAGKRVTSEFSAENKLISHHQAGRRLYPIPTPLSTSKYHLSTTCCCFGLRRQVVLIGALAVLQTVAVVTMVVSAYSETSGGSRSGVTFRSIRQSFSGSALEYTPSRILSPQSTVDMPLYVDELNVTLIEMSSILNGADCVASFLAHYETFCETALLPRDVKVHLETVNDTNSVADNEKRSDVEKHIVVLEKYQQRRLELCPCVPRHRLVGRRVPTVLKEPISATADFNVDPGGHWSPVHCVVRQRIAIIIPFRDRENHLQSLLRVLHPMLQRQLVEYTIFVVEQDRPAHIFNKAALMNAGFVEARDLGVRSSTPDGETVVHPFDCFIFHDVDMLPEDDRNFYGCASRLPRHVGAYVNKWNYNLAYYRIFGGATSFRPEVFELVNGFSNEFYGWGGEDDDMLNRIEAKNMTFVRFPKCVATYSMIKHTSDKRNPYNKASWVAWQRRPAHYDQDGLNSLRYVLVATERRLHYTWLLISLPPPR